MNWKVILVSLIAFIIIVALVSFQAIGIDLGTVALIFSLIGIVAPILNDLKKPKISLRIEKPEFEKRENGEYQGYKIITQVTNKGKKIVYNLEASINFKEQVEILRVTIETKNRQKSIKASNQPFNGKNYSWIDNEGKDTKNSLIPKLRTEDPMKLMFPKEHESGPYVAFVGGGGRMVSHGCDYDTLLKLEPNITYNIEVELKGEDNDKNTVIKKKKFKIEIS